MTCNPKICFKFISTQKTGIIINGSWFTVAFKLIWQTLFVCLKGQGSQCDFTTEPMPRQRMNAQHLIYDHVGLFTSFSLLVRRRNDQIKKTSERQRAGFQ